MTDAGAKGNARHSTRVDVAVEPHGAGLPLPELKTAGAAGADVVAAVPSDAPMTLAPGAWALVPTGLRVAIPSGYEIQVRPRSGLAFSHGVTILNTPGTIDSDYRGEVGILLINHGREPFEITRGLRIAQFVLARVEPADYGQVDTLDDTARGSGGFGSTGRE